ncbi:MAG TPA: hypothetical protein VNN73_08500 [Blastocatellia bacterium]|nr:hypothetical protein [Blastocatellia bacterium]
MRNQFWKTIIGLGAFLLVASLATQGLAQGRYRGRRYTKSDVERIIKRVEDHSDTFTKQIDKSLDRSYLDGSKAEDRINDQVKDLEKALDELRKEFDKRDDWLDVRENVVKVVNEAEDVNRIMRNRAFPPKIEAEWIGLRSDINRLAGIYNVRLLR